MPVSGRYDCRDRAGREEGIKRAAQTVASGDLVVLPTDTVYGIGCDAFQPTSPNAELTLHPADGGAMETFLDGPAWQAN